MKISLIGAGNLATHLGQALANAGNRIEQVYSRTMESATRLATLLGCDAQNDISKINSDSDLYVLSVSDAALPELVRHVCKGRDNGIFIHTAGSIPVDIFRGHAKRYGVIYPMQTFSRIDNWISVRYRVLLKLLMKIRLRFSNHYAIR